MRIPCEHPHEPRNIIFLCQECGGDLEPRRVGVSERCTYECLQCRVLFVYGEAGWERAER